MIMREVGCMGRLPLTHGMACPAIVCLSGMEIDEWADVVAAVGQAASAVLAIPVAVIAYFTFKIA